MIKVTKMINDYLISINLLKTRIKKLTYLISKEKDNEKIKMLSKRRYILYEEVREMTEIVSKINKSKISGDFCGKKN